jgi:putative PIN family toxin of toxin-antitoxin system
MKRRRKPLRVVIDTNLVLSALVFAHGRLTPLRAAWQSGQILPLVSRATVAELMRVLAYPKFGLTPTEQEELLADYLPCCETVIIPDPPPATPQCRDSFDLPFLHLALSGKADALISGDGDLLDLTGKIACPIMPAEQFLKILQV